MPLTISPKFVFACVIESSIPASLRFSSDKETLPPIELTNTVPAMPKVPAAAAVIPASSSPMIESDLTSTLSALICPLSLLIS